MFIVHQRAKVLTILVISLWGQSWGKPAAAMPPAEQSQQVVAGCPSAVLDRLMPHTVQSGESVESIAEDYGLLPSSIVAFNPSLQSGPLMVGDRLQIPPYNGSVQPVAPGATWQLLADLYRIRADVLFETNGCRETPPSQIFVPGREAQISGEGRLPTSEPDPPTFGILPLPGDGAIITQYGWQAAIAQGQQPTFHSGIDFAAPIGTAVQAVDEGTVAFVGEKDDYGLIIVINHDQGLQTRYAQLATAQVKQGDRVTTGQVIGQSGQSGVVTVPHLHFEVRLNSNSGWLAQDPGVYLNPLSQ